MNSINGKDLRRMIIAGANNLQRFKKDIDELNVFPVPDGDTGSNMYMTIGTVAREVKKCHSDSIEEVAKIASQGALRGARGNSGVILSQIFRGFYLALKDKEEAKTEDLKAVLKSATDVAYKAVMKPKEGTMLTIIRALSEEAAKREEKEVDVFLEKCIEYGYIVLDKTPDMLPVLKEAGVVDSGGKGLLTVFDGLLNGLRNSVEEELSEDAKKDTTAGAAISKFNTEDILYSYCTEFILNKESFTNEKMIKFNGVLKREGDSLVLVEDEDLIKVHVHTNHPGVVLENALTLGSLSNIKIENMKEQHTSILEDTKKEEVLEDKEVGIIVVSSGAGMRNLFKRAKADIIIDGGQTMNPSTEDFVDAINRLKAHKVLLFPNNKNIIMAAEQAKALVEDKEVRVIKTTSVPEAMSALINYDDAEIDVDLNELARTMEEIVKKVKVAEITFAVRDTKINGKEIKKGNILSIVEDKIEGVGTDLCSVTCTAIDKIVGDGADIVSIYAGSDAKSDESEKIVRYIESKYPRMDIELENGGQPLYHYLISCE